MELKFSFEDGSESLAHYGVKGMKWHKHLFGDKNKGISDAMSQGIANNPHSAPTNSQIAQNLSSISSQVSASSPTSSKKSLSMMSALGRRATMATTLASALGKVARGKGITYMQGHMNTVGTHSNTGLHIYLHEHLPRTEGGRRKALKKLNRLLGN